MNSKGMFCFLLLLAFFALEISILKESAGSFEKLNSAKLAAIEAEKASFTRALMETSVDTAIEESLLQGLILNQAPEEIKKQVNSKLAKLFSQMEKEYNQEIKVRFDSKSLSQQFLNENSSVLVAKTGKKSLQAEYCFTGGLLKNSHVVAEITGKHAKVLFKIPAGYTARKTVIG